MITEPAEEGLHRGASHQVKLEIYPELGQSLAKEVVVLGDSVRFIWAHLRIRRKELRLFRSNVRQEGTFESVPHFVKLRAVVFLYLGHEVVEEAEKPGMVAMQRMVSRTLYSFGRHPCPPILGAASANTVLSLGRDR